MADAERWTSLPTELAVRILLRVVRLRHDAAARVQAAWRSRCIRRCVSLYTQLRFLQDFRLYNPDVTTYLARCRR